MLVILCAWVGALVIGSFFWRGAWRAWRYAGEAVGQQARVLGACRSKQFRVRSSLPIAVIEIGPSESVLHVFLGGRTASHGFPTEEVELEWRAGRLARVEHGRTGTKLWPRWTPEKSYAALVPGSPTVAWTPGPSGSRPGPPLGEPEP